MTREERRKAEKRRAWLTRKTAPRGGVGLVPLEQHVAEVLTRAKYESTGMGLYVACCEHGCRTCGDYLYHTNEKNCRQTKTYLACYPDPPCMAGSPPTKSKFKAPAEVRGLTEAEQPKRVTRQQNSTTSKSPILPTPPPPISRAIYHLTPLP